MSYEMLMGMQIADEDGYAAYRRAMRPVLERMGGTFRHDFHAETIETEAETPINRVFVIAFPDRATAEAFFTDPDYLTAKETHFERSVAATAMLADYERSA